MTDPRTWYVGRTIGGPDFFPVQRKSDQDAFAFPIVRYLTQREAQELAERLNDVVRKFRDERVTP